MKLTGEQIAELAPEWATHYFTNECGNVVFQSFNNYTVMNKDTLDFGCTLFNWAGVTSRSKPIPRKPKQFDITQHEWGDDKLSLLIGEGDLISINDNCSNSCFDLFRDDAIAIAKHFGLTGEDLK